jgi:acyl-CoA synthetase (AMP-forming)/AMP-acid ligase II
MRGLMQEHPLLISSLLDHAARAHPEQVVVSRVPEGSVRAVTYAEISRRARQLARALTAAGVTPGERIATLAWNTHRHVELMFGVSGMGAVLHTANPRLFPEQIEYILNHAEDRFLFFDLSFLPLVERLAPRLPSVRRFVAMTDRAHMPASTLTDLICYEEWLACHDDDYAWPRLDESTASSMCYTSGTTGKPKGVVYTHRSTLLHSMLVCMTDGLGLSAADTFLLAAPMFHCNGWGVPYAAALCGARVLLPGPALDGASLYELMREEGATLAGGVPTVWLMLQQYVQSQGLRPREELQLRRVLIGGSAAPRAVVETFARDFGVDVIHAWGMTETSPLGAICTPLRKHRDHTPEQRIDLQLKQGRPPYGVNLRIVGVDGAPIPHDGRSSGRLLVQGHWIACGYYGAESGSALDADGWFDTGDIATIDPDGYVQITDRAKDVIKSGGEWISSIDLENAAVGHPCVAEAAAIGIPHPKWQERPLLFVVRKPGQPLTAEDLRSFLAREVAKWWLPDRIVFVEQLPHTGTGKLQKSVLREMFQRGELED